MMENIISKELLSEVTGLKVWKVLDENMGTLRYCIYPNKGLEPSEYMFPINIYELTFNKMITWAFKKHYYLNVDKTCTEIWKEGKQVHLTSSGKKPTDSKMYESVILACEWIYNKENNDK